ncbi:MAG: hypothetical protein RL156_156 [Bacteroidota bacterium]|jgi:hypothetical protein
MTHNKRHTTGAKHTDAIVDHYRMISQVEFGSDVQIDIQSDVQSNYSEYLFRRIMMNSRVFNGTCCLMITI